MSYLESQNTYMYIVRYPVIQSQKAVTPYFLGELLLFDLHCSSILFDVMSCKYTWLYDTACWLTNFNIDIFSNCKLKIGSVNLLMSSRPTVNFP